MYRFLMALLLMLSLCTVTQAEVVKVGKVDVTKYTWTGSQTSSDKWPCNGHIALSRDIIRKHKVKFGDKVIIPGVGEFIYEDWMPPQWHRRCDIYTHDKKAAQKWGRLKNQTMIIVKRYHGKSGTF